MTTEEQDRIIAMLVKTVDTMSQNIARLTAKVLVLEAIEEARKAATELRVPVSTWGRA